MHIELQLDDLAPIPGAIKLAGGDTDMGADGNEAMLGRWSGVVGVSGLTRQDLPQSLCVRRWRGALSGSRQMRLAVFSST